MPTGKPVPATLFMGSDPTFSVLFSCPSNASSQKKSESVSCHSISSCQTVADVKAANRKIVIPPAPTPTGEREKENCEKVRWGYEGARWFCFSSSGAIPLLSHRK